MRNNFAVGLTVGVVVALAAIGGWSAPSALSSSVHELQISFPTADGLVSGGDVLEAGAKIGYIADVEPQPNNTALVTIEVANDHWPLHSGITADIRPKSLLGEKYVDIHDGQPNALAYNPATVLHASEQAVPVELDQFINSLDPQTRVATQTLLDDLGAGVAGQGNNVNTAIATARNDLSNLAVTGQTLNNRDANLDQILVTLDGLLQSVTTTDQLSQLSQLITNGQTTLNAIQQEQTVFSRSFTDSAATLAELNGAIDSAVPSLRTALSEAPSLVSTLKAESDQLAALAGGINQPSVMAALEAGLIHGPSTTGGAIEQHNGQTLPIFRICLVLPVPGSCAGGSPFGTSSPTALPANWGAGATAVSFAQWMTS